MTPRPPKVLPFVEPVRIEPDSRQFEHGFRYLSKMFAEMEAELERLRKVVYDKDRNSLDNGIRKS